MQFSFSSHKFIDNDKFIPDKIDQADTHAKVVEQRLAEGTLVLTKIVIPLKKLV